MLHSSCLNAASLMQDLKKAMKTLAKPRGWNSLQRQQDTKWEMSAKESFYIKSWGGQTGLLLSANL